MRVLVVDDSASHRLTVSSALRALPQVGEIDTASSGEEAIRRVAGQTYDLVTLDIEMPGMNGFAVLRWVMAHHPLPVLVVSDRRHDRTALQALELGAFEVLGKPSARSGGLAEWKRLLAEAVEEAAQLRLDLLTARARHSPEGDRRRRGPRRPSGTQVSPAAAPTGALVVASSTGGPPALRELFASMAPFPAVVGVAQHMPAPFTRSLAQRLAAATGWEAGEAVNGETAGAGTIQIAPGGQHLTFERDGDRIVTRLRPNADAHSWCPSGDALFASAARAFGPRVVGVVLTGMGDDGAAGARAIAEAGGTVVCESAETAVIPGMPDSAARAVPAALRLPIGAIGAEVARRFGKR